MNLMKKNPKDIESYNVKVSDLKFFTKVKWTFLVFLVTLIGKRYGSIYIHSFIRNKTAYEYMYNAADGSLNVSINYLR